MASFSGYQIREILLEDVHTVVHRAIRLSDQAAVLIKSLKAKYPSLEEIAQLKHEWKVLRSLTLPGVIRPDAQEPAPPDLALILEDFGGLPLSQQLQGHPLPLHEFLNIAIQLTETLAQLHEHQIIHKNLHASNVFVHPVTQQVKITDFSLATHLTRESPMVSNPQLLAGRLAYLSPEQTGRMNRSIDFRSDFYSLGVIFYEMLTGQLPFQANDPLELVHCHIAKKPPLPQSINLDLPRAVADIVMKLLAKTAEDRYQSALGLKADLELCWAQLQASDDIAPFRVGQLDLDSQLLIPQKLYGREAEVALLMATFDRVSQGAKEMLVVSGYSGVGKSSLVYEVHKPIARQGGYFITGKFDQLKRDIPYAALIQAFQELMRQLLTERRDRVVSWRIQLSQALGPNGQVIIDVIPEVERILGPQPAVPQLGASEAENRFHRVFQQFIHVFCQPDHPLVLFLDDLQWADAASLKLIHLLITDPDSQSFFLIGAYRDNEVNATHPLRFTLDEIQASGETIHHVVLQPLQQAHVNQFISETLRTEPERSQPLAELLYRKTQGNPFFLTQLLKSLHQEQLLRFNFQRGGWEWDIDRLQGIDISDNVVELMVSQIQKLSLSTQAILKLAACIGDKFTLEVLSIVHQKSAPETASDLWDALEVGLVLPLNQSYKIPLVIETLALHPPSTESPPPISIPYKFLHDRVQQAAYSLIPDSQRRQTHLEIGQQLLRHTSGTELEERIFEIVNQLNLGAELVTDPEQRYELAHLNLMAGKKALDATAYEPATRYLTVGLGLLEAACWQTHYNLALELYTEATVAAFLTADFEQAALLAEVVLREAKTIRDKVKVYETQIRFCISQNKLKAAIAIALEVLAMMGIPLRDTPPNALTQQSDSALTVEDLAQLPQMTDPDQLAAMRIFRAAGPPTYFADAKRFTAIIFTMVDYCLQHGNSALAAYAYAGYGLILAGEMGEIDAGYQSCQLALRLLEQYAAKDIKPEVYEIFNGHVRHWKDPLHAALEDMAIGIQSGLEVGQVQYVSYIAAFYCSTHFFTGNSLEQTAQKQDQSIELLEKLKTQVCIDYGKIWRQLVANLSNETPEKQHFIGDYLHESDIQTRLVEADNRTALFALYQAKAILFYLYGDARQSVEHAETALSYIRSVMGMMNVSVHNFYYSLALVGRYPSVLPEQQQRDLQTIEQNQIQLQKFAQHAPSNHLNKYWLVEAEKARILGQFDRAIEAYDRAITAAREQGNLQEEALAAERAADFYFQRGRERLAKDYLTEAHYGYIRWGGIAKVRDLAARYPDVLPAFDRLETSRAPIQSSTHSTLGSCLDLTTVIQVNQVISSEIILDKLLNQLMNRLMENAGARTGLLLLGQADRLVLVAQGFIEADNQILLPGQPLERSANLPVAIINYVARSQSAIVLNDASEEGPFTQDAYVLNLQPKSILCLPIVHQNKLKGVLHLENNLTKGAFTQQHLEVLGLLSSQIAISIDNASLYQASQSYLQKLESKNKQLRRTNSSLAAEIRERLRVEAERDRFFTMSLDMLCIATFEGYFVRLNPAWERILGYTQAELTSQPYLDFVHPDDRARTIVAAKKLTVRLQTVCFENRYRCKDGSYRWISWQVAPFPEQKLLYGVAHDITDRKQADAEREELLVRERTARLEAEAASRLKDEFLAILSHELRTPLSPILGWVQFLRTHKLDAAATERALETIERNAKLQTQLIEDLLDVSRILQGKLSLNVAPVELTSSITQALETVSLAASAKSIQIQTVLDTDVGKVLGDANRLQQIVWNLLSNAVKFTPNGGRVEVKLIALRDQSTELSASLLSPELAATRARADFAVISVRDTGKGIHPEFLPYVFDRFRQADSSITRSYGGLGLGLAIVRHLVELHGGTVQAASAGEGQGATFTVKLPLLKAEAVQTQPPNCSASQATDTAPLKDLSILLVDDEADMRDFLTILLQQHGARVTVADSAGAALEVLAQVVPDVLISDIGMPHMDGYGLMRRIRRLSARQGGQLPAIALTAYAGEIDQQWAQSVGFHQHLAKPVDPEVLVRAIAKLVGREIHQHSPKTEEKAG